MKFTRKIAAILAVVLLIAVMQPVVFATGTQNAGETVYATTAVNVRRGPGTNHKILDCLRPGQAVQRVGFAANGWSKVIHNGKEAYVFSSYLEVRDNNDSNVNVDYSKLTRQVAIANGLDQSDYTAESWKVLAAALAEANKALNGKDQARVDACVQPLADAIAALVEVDYSTLLEVLAAVRELTGSDSQNGLWLELAEAAEAAEAQVSSGDQAAVDAAAARLKEILDKVKAGLNEQTPPEVVIQEVYVEVPPTDDYCNMGIHHVWPVVVIISLLLNLVMGALIVVYVSRKRKIRTDDIPLVDYEIGDDLI